jgi:aminopeptidase Y
MKLYLSRPLAAAAAVTALVLAGSLTALDASAAPGGPSARACATRPNDISDRLTQCVTLAGVREHQQALQDIANANGGTRAAGTPGYDASANYVQGKLEAAGWSVTTQEFPYHRFVIKSPSVLEQTTPGPTTALPHQIMTYSPSGNVTAAVTAPSGDFRGCTAADWAGFPAGNIALVSRGTPPPGTPACTFAIKALAAQAAGASGVVIYNNVAGDLNGTLGAGFTGIIPVVGITQSLGQTLLNTPGLALHLKTDTISTVTTTTNVIAEKAGLSDDNVVMAGAHLDSVEAGPGINDNGSGSAALLEVAEQLAKVKPRNTLRFAWWGGEEGNLIGSTFYVNSLTFEQRLDIALYLNFDMIGSPNYVFFIYDGDDSDATGAGPGPAGSGQIEDLFEAFFAARGLPTKGTDFTGRSDYGPFIAVGIPSGGLFTGAEGIKTAQEAATWGGTASVAYDPCYHQACDTFANNNDKALDVNSDAMAHAVITYATSTESINGVP